MLSEPTARVSGRENAAGLGAGGGPRGDLSVQGAAARGEIQPTKSASPSPNKKYEGFCFRSCVFCFVGGFLAFVGFSVAFVCPALGFKNYQACFP